VYLGEEREEYKDLLSFIAELFITEGLQSLYKNAIPPTGVQGAILSVELQTNFGGGKTHLHARAIPSLCGRANGLLPRMEVVAADLGILLPGKINRAVVSAPNLSWNAAQKERWHVVKTLWGELACSWE